MNAQRSHFPSRHTRRQHTYPELREPPFQFAPKLANPTQPKRRFEDTKAGNAALALMLIAAAVICIVRFGLIAMGKQPW